MRRKLILPVVIVAALIASTACQGTPWRGNQDGPRVWLGGDSVMFRASEFTTPRLIENYGYRGNAAPMMTIDMFPEYAERVQELGPPDHAILSLGHNNGRLGDTPAEAWDKYLDVIALIPDTQCIHFMTLNTRSPYQSVNAWNSEFSQFLRDRAAEDPRFYIIDWAAWMEGYVDAGLHIDEPFVYDGLHPNEFGSHVIGDLIEASLESCPLPPKPEA